jgi:hypothetical protein
MLDMLLVCLVCFSDCDVSAFPLERLSPAIRMLAVQREWLLPYEYLDWTTKPSGIDFLRLRRNTYEPMPPTSMIANLPPLEVLKEWLEFNFMHQAQLEQRAHFDTLQRSALLYFADECENLRVMIILAINLRMELNCNVLVQRQYLDLLRSMMGVERFYSGNFPPFVPLASVPEVRKN